MLDQQTLEASIGQHQAAQRRLGCHGGEPRPVAEHGDLPEKVALPEARHLPAFNGDPGLAVGDDIEVGAAQPFERDAMAAIEALFVEFVQNLCHFTGVDAGKEWRVADAVDNRLSVPSWFYGAPVENVIAGQFHVRLTSVL